MIIQFWTFTCINWLRTLPYIRAWGQRYRPSGFVGGSGSAPEFPFERNFDSIPIFMLTLDSVSDML